MMHIMSSIKSHVEGATASNDCIDDVMMELQMLFNTMGMGDVSIQINNIRDAYMAEQGC